MRQCGLSANIKVWMATKRVANGQIAHVVEVGTVVCKPIRRMHVYHFAGEYVVRFTLHTCRTCACKEV